MRSFLQTEQWLEFQKSIGRKGWRFNDGKVIANIIRHDLPFGKNYLYIPHGPEINVGEVTGGLRNELNQFLTFVRKIAQENKSIYLKIEPLSDSVIELIYPAGFKKSNKELQPKRTVVIDLKQSDDDLLSNLHHKTRYNIKVAEKNGITVKPSFDIDIFWKLLQSTTKRDKFSSHTKDYYEKLLNFFNEGEIKTDLILALQNDKPLAAAIILTCANSAYYLHGASDYEARKLMAPHKLHWGIIQYLKKNGLKYYDLWGINAHKWPGVTRFKLGFDGREIEYPGSFDLTFSKLWYFIYKYASKIF